MSVHEWCRDTARDEAVRAAEDAAAVPAIQHRDLPEQVALLWASLTDILGRVVRLEGEMDAGEDEEAAPAAPPGPEASPVPLAYMMAGAAEKRVFLTREEVYAYGRGLSPIEAASMIFVPLYAAPPRVRRPQRSVAFPHQRDAEWIDAIREAGGEVEE